MASRDEYPLLVRSIRWSTPELTREVTAALDEIDSLRAALRLSQDARRGTR